MFCSRKGNGIPITCTATSQKWTGQPIHLAGSKNPLTLGMGSVKVTIPLQIASKEALQPSFEDNDFSCLEGKRILLAEDNELNREIAEEMLKNAGFIVDSVNDGIDAVERMKDLDENTYDLILMDIQMPKMDGYTATKEIRHLSNRRKANIPIVAMTANAFEEDKKKSMAAGMNAHLSKPVNIKNLVETLDGIFKNDKYQ